MELAKGVVLLEAMSPAGCIEQQAKARNGACAPRPPLLRNSRLQAMQAWGPDASRSTGTCSWSSVLTNRPGALRGRAGGRLGGTSQLDGVVVAVEWRALPLVGLNVANRMGGAPKYFAMPQVKAMDLTILMHLEVAAKPIGGRPVSAQSTESRYSKGSMAQVGRICEGCPSIEAWTAAAAQSDC